MDLGAGRDLHDELAGACLHAGAAVGALLGVHHGGAVGADGHGAELAGADAGAQAEAAKGAVQGTGGHLGGADAVMDAPVLIALVGVDAAVTADESHLALAGGSLHAHDGGDGGGVLGAGGGAGGDRGLALHDGGGAGAAAGEAAAAAVGAGQVAQDLFLTGVLLHLEDLGGDGQDQAEDGAHDRENDHGADDIHNIHFSSLLSRRQTGRRSP